jgi:hypothetical protein
LELHTSRSRLTAPLVALKQHLEGPSRRVEPRARRIRRLALGQRQPTELKQVRGGSEAEIEIDAALEARDDSLVERPHASGRPHDPEVDRP